MVIHIKNKQTCSYFILSCPPSTKHYIQIVTLSFTPLPNIITSTSSILSCHFYSRYFCLFFLGIITKIYFRGYSITKNNNFYFSFLIFFYFSIFFPMKNHITSFFKVLEYIFFYLEYYKNVFMLYYLCLEKNDNGNSVQSN